MTWYEALLWLGAGAGAIAAIVKIVKPFTTAVRKRLDTIDEIADDVKTLKRHDKDQYLAILRLTVMNAEMPIEERIEAGREYEKNGGNGKVKEYYKKMLKEHTI